MAIMMSDAVLALVCIGASCLSTSATIALTGFETLNEIIAPLATFGLLALLIAVGILGVQGMMA